MPPIRTKPKRKSCAVHPYKRRVKYDKLGFAFSYRISTTLDQKSAVLVQHGPFLSVPLKTNPVFKVPLMYYQNSDLLVHTILYYQKNSRRTRSGNIASRGLSPTL